ncbi:four helix bundle protein [Mangrovimonas cancribranchiae]|uniref:Four helix bundle protein n=1 Tax=Mangrovimonas cancribranchiae TaxID=3080055 RepID=A0AAU6NYB5_9FLAO
MKRHNFKKLHIWIEAMDLVDDNYSITRELPDYEKFGLRSQMNRCVISIASNISEGTSKKTNKHFIQYLENSLGSAFEWETQLIICYRQNYLEEDKFLDLQNKVQIIQSKISKFIDKLNLNG